MRSATSVYQTFFDELRARALTEYHLTTAGCLGPCAEGPNVLVYPEGVLYGHVTPADVAEIVTEHLVGGRPVRRLVQTDASAPP
jgi:(2Fe-2S) ferredoxin